MANDGALDRSARRWDLWRHIYWPIRAFSGCSDDLRQMVAGLQNVTSFPRKTLRAATVILLARFYYFIPLISYIYFIYVPVECSVQRIWRRRAPWLATSSETGGLQPAQP